MRSICQLSMMPLRAEPRHSSEMVSMILFGEEFEVLESIENWHKVICRHDGYEGWITARKLINPQDKFWSNYDNESPVYVQKSFTAVQSGDHSLSLTSGSRMPLYSSGKFAIDALNFELKEEFKQTPDTIEDTANTFINTPYLWGGRSVLGIDCSGLTQIVFRLHGFSLPRDAWQQAEKGEEIKTLAETKAGDLAFFNEGGGRISHVGIILEGKRIIHASEFVRIDRLDENGIYNTWLNKYTIRPCMIRRYF